MTTTPPDRPEDALQSRRFLGLYALAVAGGSASYAPFLTLLLPNRATELWGAEAIVVLSYTAFVGAVAASLANIGFGWASDRTGGRRGWILAGLAGSSALLVAMPLVHSFAGLLAMIFFWQCALNMMLGPLAAWAGDCIPDEQKGTLGGLMSFAPGMGALTGALVTLPGLAGPDTRLWLVVAVVASMVLPVLAFGDPRPMPHLNEPRGRRDDLPDAPVQRLSSPVRRMWFARLFIQIAEAALFAFLLLWLRSLDDSVTDNQTATIFTLVLFGAVPLAIAAGRWSDRHRRPMLPLAVSAGIGAVGLGVMAAAEDVAMGVAGYVLFGVVAAVFLALHASQTLRVLPRPETRGRDLGIFNLTNTVPSLIMPWLILALIPLFGFKALFVVLGILVFLSFLLLAPMLRR